MNRVLDKMLCERFPALYKDRHGDVRRTAMCWGFSCGDGWFPLLFELSEKIDAELKRIDAESGFPEGALHTHEVRTAAQEGFAVVQVKEKFGTLRYYCNGTTDAINDAIREAERKSAITCEECGEPGVLRGRGYVHTACDKCAKGELPVGCEITQKPCDKGTIGCYHNHAEEDAAEEAELQAEDAEIERRRQAAEGGLRPPTAKELDPESV